MKIYKVRTLFSGNRIAGLDPAKLYVAVPDRGYKGEVIEVTLNKEKMRIENWESALAYRIMEDKYGRGHYTLGYFEWKPNET